MNKAIYAFSADPIHYGHIDIIERAAKVFDQVTVAIGAHHSKQYLFTLEERTTMARRALTHIPQASVTAFQGLLVDFACEQGIATVVKGLRSEADLDYELMLHHIGESQKLSIDTFFLPAQQHMTHISSTAVKALQKEQGLIHEYVPLHVKQKLEERISQQYLVGVTGEIGVGKSFVSRAFEAHGYNAGIDVHNIDLDHIGHKILGELTDTLYVNTRKQIVKEFGKAVRGQDDTIDRKALGEIVFNDADALEILNAIMYTPLLVRLRREIYNKQGIVLLNGALLAESNLTKLCNNNVILVTADEKSQQRRLEERGLSAAQIARRKESQYSTAQKEAAITKHKGHGMLWKLDSSDGASHNIFEEVYDYFGLGVKPDGRVRYISG